MEEKESLGKSTESRKEDILKVSYELFIKFGYTKTSMRKIASEAGVSLGLAAYHFTNKREIAAELLKWKFAIFSDIAGTYVNKTEDPILYSLLLVSLNYTVLSSKKFNAFYKDALREDIYLEVIVQSGNETYLHIRDKYQPELDDEKAEAMGWYGNYISVSMERTLVLYGGNRLIINGSIPEMIFKSYIELWHFPDIDKEVERACIQSKELINQILLKHPDIFD